MSQLWGTCHKAGMLHIIHGSNGLWKQSVPKQFVLTVNVAFPRSHEVTCWRLGEEIRHLMKGWKDTARNNNGLQLKTFTFHHKLPFYLFTALTTGFWQTDLQKHITGCLTGKSHWLFYHLLTSKKKTKNKKQPKKTKKKTCISTTQKLLFSKCWHLSEQVSSQNKSTNVCVSVSDTILKLRSENRAQSCCSVFDSHNYGP